ncbi:NtaA/DmoA family FMN-dependent monooxygenase [Steroidobacter sp.]|uniref:NtaA/DmoA family FMN-dependent monooxygenase n=1 Tax=Steroidobacter sp. TaxID=1978227 RepID=UPI001A383108|nr:NtaA/DmoA family FMN-dependent monooxygenase [Steroidobacter sp.]MBL8266578.1 NtaA/DmoA family FMN-dependent monooxygenase [Steroidobacter sp.]
MAERTLHLAVNTGSGNLNRYGAFDVEEFVETARLAETGLFDAVFLPNVSFLRAEGPVGGGFDPLVALTLMAQATSKVGLVGTVSVTLHHPYSIARSFASLEHLSHGRMGWNVVTTRNKPEGLNYGFDPLPDRRTRYAHAAEAIEIVNALWDSWQEGSVVRHPDATVTYERAHIKPIDYVGEHFRVAGPLQIPSFPDTRTVITQAGGSDEGMELAAKYADAVFSSTLLIEPARDYYGKLKTLAAKHGRTPGSIAVLPGLATVIGSTQAEARRRSVSEEELATELQRFARWAGVAAENLDLDGTFPVDLLKPSDPIFGSVGFDDSIRNYLKHNRSRPVRELLADGIHHSATNHRRLVGTPEQIADNIEEWFRSGASDGFILMPSGNTAELRIFIDEVVPLLQKRNLFRREYAETTLRERLGLRSK